MNRKTGVAVTLMILGLLAVGGGVELVFLSRLVGERRVLEQTLAAERRRVDSLVELAEEVESYKVVAGQWSKLLPVTEEEVAGFAGELERVARENGVEMELELEDFPKKAEVGGRYVTALGFEAMLKGSYPNLVAWMGEVGRLDYLTRVDKIQVTVSKSGVGEDMVVRGVLIMRMIK